MSQAGKLDSNSGFLLYKLRFVTFVLIFGYAFLHVKLTGEYVDANVEQYFNFSVRLPYGQRLLVPILVWLVHWVLPLQIYELFFLWEVFFAFLCWWAVYQLLLMRFKAEMALLLSWLFILLLPLLYVINYRLTQGINSNVFYAGDTPSLAFIILGFYFCWQKKWWCLYADIAIATLNRESAVLLVLLIPFMHWDEKHTVWRETLGALLCYALIRGIILYFLAGKPGTLVEWYAWGSTTTLFEFNRRWLLEQQYLFLFAFCFAGLPLFWFLLRDYIPPQFLPVRFLVLAYFIGLLMVGHVSESRIYGEIFSLMYLPVCLGMQHWCMGNAPYPRSSGIRAFFQRHGVLLILLAVILAYRQINQCIIWLTSG